MATSTSAVPTTARNKTALFALSLALIMYVDRVALAQAAPFIRTDLGLSQVEMGWVFTTFGWAYALFEIPGGWLGDRFGSRKVLERCSLRMESGQVTALIGPKDSRDFLRVVDLLERLDP